MPKLLPVANHRQFFADQDIHNLIGAFKRRREKRIGRGGRRSEKRKSAEQHYNHVAM